MNFVDRGIGKEEEVVEGAGLREKRAASPREEVEETKPASESRQPRVDAAPGGAGVNYGDVPLFGSQTFYFETTSFLLLRTILRDLRGPLASYITSTFSAEEVGLGDETGTKGRAQTAGSTAEESSARGHGIYPCPPPYAWPPKRAAEREGDVQ